MPDRKKLGLREEAAIYRGPTQNARVLSEDWTARQMFCPHCTSEQLEQFPNNRPVADFYCSNCDEQFEIKAQKARFGRKIVDGAYSTMIERLASDRSPNLLLMRYSKFEMSVSDVIIIPKQFFAAHIIEKRKPLAPSARRAGWIGCNIRLDLIPKLGRITLVENSIRLDPEIVRGAWRAALPLREAIPSTRAWLSRTLQAVERLPEEFELSDLYEMEDEFAKVFPKNNNIRPKLRQQLQLLRDMAYLEFLGAGRYRKLV